MTMIVVLGGLVLSMGLLVIWFLFLLRPKGWGFKGKKSPFPAIEGSCFSNVLTFQVEPGQEVCLQTKRSRQCFGIDCQGRLGWFNTGPPSPGHLITFHELSGIVKRGRRNNEDRN